jgi:hypothetical protein
VDEVGENISQKGDGNAGGQKLMVATDMRARVQNSFKDNQLMVLGFTEEGGHSVTCAIIITMSKLRVTNVMGCNPLSNDAEEIGDEDMQGLEKYVEEMKDEHSNGIGRM